MSEDMSYVHLLILLKGPNADFRRRWLGLNYADTDFDTAAPINASTATTSAGGAGRAGTVLGKRAREWYGISRKADPQADDNDSSSSGSPQKRAKPSASRVLEEAEGSTERTHPFDTRAQPPNQKYIYDRTTRSRELHPITAQGLYPSPLLGPSAQEMVLVPEQEQLGESGTQDNSRGMAQQQTGTQTGGSADGPGGLYAIPGTLTERQRLMLQTTEHDIERGAVGIIKCKICPTVDLQSWQCFRRHCNTSEDHPAELTFCDQCGDHFGRRDSGKRHRERKLQEECRTTPRDQAEWKTKITKQLFDDFNVKMDRCLRTGEELGLRFAAITHAKVPTKSKKKPKHRRKQLEDDS
jgi:hypothetical protein